MHLSLYVKQNSCSQVLQLTHSIQPSSLIVCTLFSQHYAISFQNLQLFLDYEYLFLMTSLSEFSDLVDLKYGGYLHISCLCSLTILPLRFFCFSSRLLDSSVIKRGFLFFSCVFSRYFRHWTDLLQKLECVISSWEVSGGSTTLRILTEGSAEIGNTF